jgi:hypothetical protein
MNIISLQWVDSSRKSIKVVTDEGTKFCQWPNNTTWIRERIEEAIAGGMVIQSEDPPPTPIDFSDINNLDKIIKAIGLTIAEVSGKTPVQIRDIFKAKYETL